MLTHPVDRFQAFRWVDELLRRAAAQDADMASRFAAAVARRGEASLRAEFGEEEYEERARQAGLYATLGREGFVAARYAELKAEIPGGPARN